MKGWNGNYIQWVPDAHLPDKLPKLAVDHRASSAPARLPAPIGAEAVTMPV